MSFAAYKTVLLPANGTAIPMDLPGVFFICTNQSAGRFEMSFDGQQFFEWQKGLKLRVVEPFRKLWFKILSGTSTANTISFYYGTAEVSDARLNVIDESSKATIQTINPRTVIIVRSDFADNTTSTNFLNNNTLILEDPIVVDGLTYRRASLRVTNYTSGRTLYCGIGNGFGGEVDHVFAELPGDGVPLDIKVCENIYIGNKSGFPVRFRLEETFYEDAEIFR